MKFSELPTEVQVVAAKALAEKLLQPQGDKKPASDLAREVKEAFVELYTETNTPESKIGCDRDIALATIDALTQSLEQTIRPFVANC